MKINVEIELDTIWADESTLSDELIYRIKSDVIKEIQNRVKDQIEDKITTVVSQLVKQGMSEKILQHYNEVTGQNIIAARKTITGIDGRSFTKENVTLDEYITSMFFERNGYNNLADVLEKRSKEIITNLQKRYDILFASQIVNKMAESKLLKDDAIANLLSDNLPKTQ